MPCPPEQPKTGDQVGSIPPLKLNRFDQRILDLHDAERAAVGAPPLRWNPALEQSATAWAQQLARTGQLVHAPREGRGIERENLSQGMIGWTTDQMMRNWLSEKRNFISGTFPDISRTGDWYAVGHYSQMIWPTTTDLGCGMASGSGYQWLVCRYSPGGNKPGQAVGLPPVVAGDQANAPPAKPTAYQWIDVKTGKPVRTLPIVPGPGEYKFGNSHIVLSDPGDPNRAFDPETGRNFAKQNGAWIDVKTGEPVRTLPIVPGAGKYMFGSSHVVLSDPGDPNRAFDPETGRNFAKVPVTPPK